MKYTLTMVVLCFGALFTLSSQPGEGLSALDIQVIEDWYRQGISLGFPNEDADVFHGLMDYLSRENPVDIHREITETDTLLMASILYSDSVSRHFYYVLPPTAESGQAMPLFVWLHGGVSTDDLRTLDPDVIRDWVLIPRLLDEGYAIAFPCGQMHSTWWDPVGEEGILDIVAWLKLNFHIDDSRVFVGGFSDGASGSLSLMMLRPSCFAGYLAFSGHMGVAAIDGDRATYVTSLQNRSGIVTHSDEDGLYPTWKMAPTVALAQSAGADIEYYTFSGFEHDPAYLPEIEDRIVEFLTATVRPRFPERIVWEAGEPSSCDWLEVDSIIHWPLLGPDSDDNMVLVSERLTFGFYPDWDFQGPGVLVSGVVEGDVPAARLGLQGGDIIIGFMGSEIASLEEVGILQASMAPGDSFSLDVNRSGEILTLRDRFNPPEFYWLFPRVGPSVSIEAEYADNRFDLNVNRMCCISLLLHPDMVDFSSEITVTCNGNEVFRGMVQDDYRWALDNLIENLDADRAYMAVLDLDLQQLMMPML